MSIEIEWYHVICDNMNAVCGYDTNWSNQVPYIQIIFDSSYMKLLGRILEKKSSVRDVRECFSYWTWDLDFWKAAGGDLGRQ